MPASSFQFSYKKFAQMTDKQRARQLHHAVVSLARRWSPASAPALQELTHSPDWQMYCQLVQWHSQLMPTKIQGMPEAQQAQEASEVIQPTAVHLYDDYIAWCRQAELAPKEANLFATAQPDYTTRREPSVPWSVLLHNLRSGHNVGSIIRSAEYFGWQAAYLSGYTPGPDKAAVQSASMGTANWLDIRSFSDSKKSETSQAMLEFKESHPAGQIVALELTDEAHSMEVFSWPDCGLLVVGNEETGIDSSLLQAADTTVAIPGFGRKASLNVANAFCIAAWELRRQRLTNG